MRKHFLLLFLMALLPFAGWAETVNVTVTLYDFTIPYGSDEPTVTTLPPATIKVEGADLDDIAGYLTFTRENTSTDVGTYEYTLTKALDTGDYIIYLSSNNAKMTIEKAPNEFTTNPVPAEDNTYAAVSALEDPYALVATLGVAKFGDVEYIVSDTEPSATATGWSTASPTAQYAGDYKIWYRVAETANYEGIDIAPLGIVTIEGDPITEFEAPEAIVDLAYTSEAQDLITEGSATGGTMKYKVGDGEWSTAIPQGTDATAYTVYWMIEGDNTHNNHDGGNFVVTIGKGTPTINPAPALIAGFTYDGTEKEIISSEGEADLSATISYQLQKQTGEETWENVGAATTTPATLKIKNAGVYRIQYSIAGTTNVNAVDAANTDPVTIEKAPLAVSIKGCSKVYGDPDPEFEIVYSGWVNNEDKTVLSSQAVAGREAGDNAGYYALSFTTHAAADNYIITESETTNYLLINPRSIETLTDAKAVSITFGANPVYDGTAKEANITSVSFDGAVKTLYNEGTGEGDYAVSYDGETNINVGNAAEVTITGKNNYTGSVVKTFSIDAAGLYIIPTAASKTYGEADPTEFAYTLEVGGEAVPNNTLNGTVTLARVAGENVGTYKIYVVGYEAVEGDNYAPANVMNDPDNATGDNKIALFTINATSNNVLKLKFNPDIADAKKTKVYGDADPEWTMDDLVYAGEGLVGDDEWEVVKNNLGVPTFTLASEDAGETTVSVEGLGSPNYPDVEVEDLTFTITARPITVTVSDQAIEYGESLDDPVQDTNWELTEGTIVVGDELGLTLTTVDPLASYAVSNDPYEDAITAEIENDNYDLTVINGDLTVTGLAAGITLARTDESLDDLIKAYDGENVNVTLDRNIGRTEAWFAMVLPFEVSVAELSQKFGYAVVNVLNEANTDESKVKFKLHMSTIEANQPFLVKVASTIDAPVPFGEKEIVYDEAPMRKDAAGNEFYGVFKSTVLTASPNLWVMVPAKDKFQKLDQNGTTLTPINAYLKTKEELDAFAPAIFVEDIDGSVTAINAIGAEIQQNGEGWYNLNGMKMSAPTQKGVYIQNGKKVVLK